MRKKKKNEKEKEARMSDKIEAFVKTVKWRENREKDEMKRNGLKRREKMVKMKKTRKKKFRIERNER